MLTQWAFGPILGTRNRAKVVQKLPQGAPPSIRRWSPNPFLRVKAPNPDFIACDTVLEPIFDRFWIEMGWPLDPQILQNYVRGVRNQTLRIDTLDVDPMSFRIDFRHPKWPHSGPKMAPRRSVGDPPMVAEPDFEGQNPQR